MIFSAQSLLSDDQAITATAASTNILDLGATGTVKGHSAAIGRDVGVGTPIPILIQVTEAFNTLTSLTVEVQVDDNSSFSSAKTITSEVIALADLVVGAKTAVQAIPTKADERYLRCLYTVTGTNPTLGKITAGVVPGVQNNG